VTAVTHAAPSTQAAHEATGLKSRSPPGLRRGRGRSARGRGRGRGRARAVAVIALDAKPDSSHERQRDLERGRLSTYRVSRVQGVWASARPAASDASSVRSMRLVLLGGSPRRWANTLAPSAESRRAFGTSPDDCVSSAAGVCSVPVETPASLESERARLGSAAEAGVGGRTVPARVVAGRAGRCLVRPAVRADPLRRRGLATCRAGW
jgi:hypothetical protein